MKVFIKSIEPKYINLDDTSVFEAGEYKDRDGIDFFGVIMISSKGEKFVIHEADNLNTAKIFLSSLMVYLQELEESNKAVCVIRAKDIENSAIFNNSINSLAEYINLNR